jgi:hypothetical protein
MRRRNELTEAILKALETPNHRVQGTPRTFGESKIARNTVFAFGATVLRASKALVEEYVRLDKIIVGMRDAESEGVAESWTEEVEKAGRRLRIGADTAIRNVKKVVWKALHSSRMTRPWRHSSRWNSITSCIKAYCSQNGVSRRWRRACRSLRMDRDLATCC